MKYIRKNGYLVLLLSLLCTFSLDTLACNYFFDKNEGYVDMRGGCAKLTNKLKRAKQVFKKVYF